MATNVTPRRDINKCSGVRENNANPAEQRSFLGDTIALQILATVWSLWGSGLCVREKLHTLLERLAPDCIYLGHVI